MAFDAHRRNAPRLRAGDWLLVLSQRRPGDQRHRDGREGGEQDSDDPRPRANAEQVHPYCLLSLLTSDAHSVAERSASRGNMMLRLLWSWSSPRTCPSSCLTRSEEHTSELQSRQYLVCRLLLEKNNKHHTVRHY